MEILIDVRKEGFGLKESLTELIDRVAEQTLEHLNKGKNFEISISFVTNEEIRELNKTYLGNDYVTDVLSFPMEDEFGSDYDNTVLGDVVISIDKIREQAEEFNHSFERELAYLFVHSLLHLFGYDHINEQDKDIMRNEEKSIMDKLKIYK
ncbi:MAG: Endoribonuclease YbeY [Clostridiales bacterium 38_11]|nr:MAG: Endoribonuclease YbeY [Clostridiales bacterium 38_11]HBH13468.1 rRNA maturation RNase YbeY [Clostridiales bacterium]